VRRGVAIPGRGLSGRSGLAGPPLAHLLINAQINTCYVVVLFPIWGLIESLSSRVRNLPGARTAGSFTRLDRGRFEMRWVIAYGRVRLYD
jgi:hypothetical protein